ncbi:MAG: GNAT family N-acetyltransferase [Flavobacteriales bacterium]
MKIDLGHFCIRTYKKSDAKSLAKYANNIKVWRNIQDRFPHPYTIVDAEWWIKEVMKESPKVNFAIAIDEKVVGGIGFSTKNDVYRKTLEIGYWLGEGYWGKGIMTQAVKAIINYGFENFEVVRIEAKVFNWNEGSMRVLEKAGFEKEAVLKNRFIKQGKIGDEHIYAIFKEEEI